MTQNQNFQQLITQNYLKTKIKPGMLIFWLLIGFFIGNGLGNIVFDNEGDNIIQLTFVYSSEKATWIGETLSDFEQHWEEMRKHDPSLKPISLDLQPYGSGSSLIALLNGEIKPIIWSPASNIWVPLLNSKWKDMSDKNFNLVNNYTRLIYSPIILATWENFNKTYNINGINDLHNLIVNQPNLVKLAHTDPRSSNSGFMASIMIVGAKLQLDPGSITMAEISNASVLNFMKEIESAAVQYGESTGFLGRYMRDNGPKKLNIAFLYENLVQDYSLAAKENFGEKMVAIYPKEGSLYSDHPFCILNADWVSEEQKMVAREYIKFIGHQNNIIKAIKTGFRPINQSLLQIQSVANAYKEAFNPIYGVTSNASRINELLPPSDGEVISRIPDLWLMTRAT